MPRPLRIGLTMRMLGAIGYSEKRDALAQDWFTLLDDWNAIPICIPNKFSKVDHFVKMVDLVILTGGNDISLDAESNSISNVDSFAHDRDLQEYKIIELCIEHKVPLLGICRGMQLINYKFGGSLKNIDIEKHVAKEHGLNVLKNQFLTPRMSVNSYHHYGIGTECLGRNLDILALSHDNLVEAFAHQQHLIVGVMWHPERNHPVSSLDKDLIMKLIRKSQGVLND